MKEKDYKLIEAYIDGTLNEEQKKEFDERVNDEYFAKELHTQIEMVEGVKTAEKEKLKSQYKAMLDESSSPASTKKFSPKYLWIALLLLLLVLIYFGRTSFSTPMQEDIFADFFSPLPPLEIQRGVAGENMEYIKALRSYQEENYPAALVQFEELMDADPLIPNYKLYGGISALATNQTDRASSLLTQVWVAGDDFSRQHAEWYYTLTLLRQAKLVEAKEQAARMEGDTTHLYRKMAGLLVKELEGE